MKAVKIYSDHELQIKILDMIQTGENKNIEDVSRILNIDINQILKQLQNIMNQLSGPYSARDHVSTRCLS